MKTYYLPAENEVYEKVLEQYFLIQKEIGKTFFLDAVPILYLILNHKRQIVWANKAAIKISGFKDIYTVLGLRPGELLNCVHAYETEGGCGTTEFCTTCGAAKSLKSALLGDVTYQECRIEQIDKAEAIDLKVTSHPFNVNNINFIIFTAEDISHENRRKVLERIFFHDIANTIGNLNGYLNLLDPSNAEEFISDKQILISLSQDLQDEIQAQKILLNAENDELELNITSINSKNLLFDLINKYKRHYLAQNISINYFYDSQEAELNSDATLLKRIIGNMLKNALEASNPGSTIIVGSNLINYNISFWVHNEGYIPREIQLQLFHRSFSTKGIGRGLGTYSMKLLGEKYLGGKVLFTSSETEGTKFKIILPLKR